MSFFTSLHPLNKTWVFQGKFNKGFGKQSRLIGLFSKKKKKYWPPVVTFVRKNYQIFKKLILYLFQWKLSIKFLGLLFRDLHGKYWAKENPSFSSSFSLFFGLFGLLSQIIPYPISYYWSLSVPSSPHL